MPGKRGQMPRLAATLELLSHDGETATFHVHDEDRKDTGEYSKWVAVNGYGPYTDPTTGEVDPDAHVSAAFKGIRWDEGDPPADDCEVSLGLAVNPATPPVRFEAFVVVFPAVTSPRSNVVEFTAA